MAKTFLLRLATVAIFGSVYAADQKVSLKIIYFYYFLF